MSNFLVMMIVSVSENGFESILFIHPHCPGFLEVDHIHSQYNNYDAQLQINFETILIE